MNSPQLCEPILAASGVRKVYGGEVALANVSLTIAAGTIHGLLGANGAGKSTLVRSICGVERRDAGVIAVDGVALPAGHGARDAREAGIVHIDQDRALCAELSIAENVALTVGHPTRRGGLVKTSALLTQARAALEIVGLDHDVTTPVGELPISDQTLVAIARALATSARLILLDEPTADLTPAERTALLARLRTLAAEGVSCVLITHSLGEALDVCDAITILRDGIVVDSRPAGELDERSVTALMVGEDAGVTWDDRVASASRHTSIDRRSPGPRLTLDGISCERLGPLSLDVRPGEVVALTGTSDSGYLLVGDLLSGLIPRSSGTMQLNGRPYTPRTVADALRDGVACVPADRTTDGLALEMTARENLLMRGHRFSSRLRGIRAGLERSWAQSILVHGAVKPADPEAMLSTLSGGNMQKILLAKWLAEEPELLVLCEPTVGIDVAARTDIYARVRNACADGLAVLLASSDLEEVATISDRVFVMQHGAPVGELVGDEITIGNITELCHDGSLRGRAR